MSDSLYAPVADQEDASSAPGLPPPAPLDVPAPASPDIEAAREAGPIPPSPPLRGVPGAADRQNQAAKDPWQAVFSGAPAANDPWASVFQQAAPEPAELGEYPMPGPDTIAAVKNVGNAFVHGLGDGWTGGQVVQPGLYGLSQGAADDLKKWTSYPEVAKGQETVWQAFNEAFVFPAVRGLAEAAALNARVGASIAQVPLQAGGALFRGLTEATAEVAGRDIAGLLEIEGIGGGVTRHVPTPREPAAPATRVPVEPEPHPAVTAFRQEPFPVTPEIVQAAKDQGIIGTQAEWDGTSVYAAARPEEVAGPLDIHGVARAIEPELFEEYDRLSSMRDNARQALNDEVGRLRSNAESEIEANAPHTDEIADLRDTLDDPRSSARSKRDAEARLPGLEEAQQAFLLDQDRYAFLTRETPEITDLRREVMANDERMRDLSPQVGAAYREAATRMPAEPEVKASERAPLSTNVEDAGDMLRERLLPAGWELGTDPKNPDVWTVYDDKDNIVGSGATATEAVQAGYRAAESKTTIAPPEPPATPATPPLNIAAHVADRLTGAGRPTEEAQAMGALVQAYYETKAERFGGNRGTAADIYREEGPQIVGRGERGNAAGMLQTVNGKSVLTLFARADATTAIHEFGHQWFNDMLRDAASADAPANLRVDAATVRSWLGVEEGQSLNRRHQERVARAFENYMMEGHAPSSALARVFEQFKDWMAKVYQTVKQQNVPLNNDIRGVFDRWFSNEPVERGTVAPEREGPPPKPREIGAIMRDERVRESVARQIQSQEIIDYAEWQAANRNAATNATPKPAEPTAPGERPRTPRSEAQIMREDGVGPVEAKRIQAGEFGALADWQAEQRAAGKPTVEAAPAAPSSISPEEAQRIARDMLAPKEPEPPPTEPAPVEPVTATPVLAKNFGPEAKPPPPKPMPAYVKVPREPKRLLEFLKEGRKINEGTASEQIVMRGLKDEGGDIAAIIGGTSFKRGRERGLLNSRDGEPLDAAGERAYEAGYFPQGRPDFDEIKDAIRDDLNGQPPRYSMHDDAHVAAYEQAVKHNREIDRLSAEHGIDPRGMTLDAFTKAIEDKVGKEEFDAKALIERAHAIDEANEMRDDLTHWEDSEAEHADRLTPDEFERLWGEASASQELVDREPGHEEPGVSGGPEKPGAEGAGSERGGAGDAGQAGGAGEGKPESFRVTEPTATLAETKARRRADVPKIANVRLEYIDEERWDDLAREVAGELSLSGDPRVQEGSIKALSLHAINNAALDAWDVAKAAWQKAPTPENLVEMERAKGRAAVAFENLSYGLTDWGKTGNQWQKIIRESKRRIADIAAGNPDDMTLFQRQTDLALMDQMDTPEQVGKALRDDYLSRWDKFNNGLLAFYLNNILSGPVTHAGYAVGNLLTNLVQGVVTIPTQVGFDIARSAMTGAERTVWIGESKAYLFGLANGTMKGVAPAIRAFLTGEVSLEGGGAPQIHEQQILPNLLGGHLGYALETSTRNIRAIHVMNYSMRYTGEISRLAYAAAMEDGIPASEMGGRIQRYLNEVPPEDMAYAHDEAIRSALMRRPEPNSTQASVTRLIGRVPGGRYVVPFPQIGMNLAEEGIVNMTPLGFLSSHVREQIAAGGRMQSVAAGRMLAGTGIATGIAALALNGAITGPGPDKLTPEGRAQARILEDQGWAPYSVRWGDSYIPYRKGLGPLGELIGMTAALADAARAEAGGQSGEAMARLAHGFGEVVMDETWLRGVHDAFEAATHPEEKLPHYLTNIATNFIPLSQFNSQIARQIDPDVRSAHGLLETAQNKIPLASEGLHPVIGPWGQPVLAHSAMGAHAFRNDPVNQRMIELGMGVKGFERAIKGVPMDEGEQEQFGRLAGTLAHQMLLPMVTAPGFSSLPAAMQMKQIDKTISLSRNQAEKVIQAQDPAKFIGGALTLKQQMLTTGRKPPPAAPYLH